MIELHLIGYTEDGDDLVFDLDAGGEGRYVVAVEPDLLATLEAARRERIVRGLPVDVRAEPARGPSPAPSLPEQLAPPPRAVADNGRGPRPAPDPGRTAARSAAPVGSPGATVGRAVGTRTPAETPAPPSADDTPTDDTPAAPADDAPAEEAAPSDQPSPAGDAVAAREPVRPAAEPVRRDAPPAAEAGPVDQAPGAGVAARSGLSPAEIQARLRAGRSVRAVAREAGADAAWVERWHVPIVAERERVLADARARRLDRPRARPLGVAVDRSLQERGVAPEESEWRVVRRDDGRWRVSVRFEEGGRPRTATWLLDPDVERLRAQSPLATELSAPGGHAARR